MASSHPPPAGVTARIVARIENFVFRFRLQVVLLTVLLAGLALIPASRIEITAGFDKQLPSRHPFVTTFKQYQDTFFGANRIVVAVHARKGTIWNEKVLRKVLKATQAVTFLKGVDRGSVTSIWTPNVFFTEITADGFKALPLTGGEINPDSLSAATMQEIRNRVQQGGYLGNLVSRDESSAMIVADLSEQGNAEASSFDYVAFNRELEMSVRAAIEDKDVEVQVIGFAKAVGDISDHASHVFLFILAAIGLTLLSVWLYCRSIALTVLPVACSMTSMVWQLATLKLIGLGLDPMAMLVPFLVLAIGVSHGVQQINHITRGVANGRSTLDAARGSFRDLLVPGVLALLTAFASFSTLALIAIPAVRELAIAACIGVAYKVVSNLVLLPVAASWLEFDAGYAQAAARRQANCGAWMGRIAVLASPRLAWLTVAVGAAVMAYASLHAVHRQVGNVRPGVPELRDSARFNRDALDIAGRFDVGLDWFTIVMEVAPGKATPCLRADALVYVDRYASFMAEVPGVVSVGSLSQIVRLGSAAASEGLARQANVPRDAQTLGSLVAGLNYQIKGLASNDCAVQGINVYLKDQRAETLKTVAVQAKLYADRYPHEGIVVRLASGNAGLQAAVNEVLESSELPMLAYVYATIAALVFLAYRRWDAVLACCVPLTIATCLGYWFLQAQGIGLTVATLPVMVLATGIGVDYAFYIYSSIRGHQQGGESQASALRAALAETGIATLFTALTLSAGVAIWAFSPLQFQADMGLLLTVMFLVNMVTALVFLPATVVVLDKLSGGMRHAARGDAAFSCRPACDSSQSGAIMNSNRSMRPEASGLRRRHLLGAAAASALAGSAWAVQSEAAAWPAALPALRYRDPARQPILAAALAGKRAVAAGMRGVIIYSDDLKSYSQAAVPVSADLTALAFVDETYGWAVGNDGVILATRDGGKSWTLQRQAFGSDQRLFSVLFSSRLEGLAVGAFGLCLQTRDGGASWDEVEVAKQGANTPHLYQLLPGHAGATVVVGEFGAIFLSPSHGVWNPVMSPVKSSLFGGAVCGDQLVAVGLQGAAVTSHDGGASWQAAHVEGAPNLVTVLGNPMRQPVLLDGRGGLLRSCDAGRSFGARTPSGAASPTCAVWPAAEAGPQLFSFDGVGAKAAVADDKKARRQTSCAS